MRQIFVDFRPAEVVNKREVYVSYYIFDQDINKLVRKRVRCNHVKGAKERLKYARLLCAAINKRLFEGWSPIYEKTSKISLSINKAISKFLIEKSKSSRQATIRSYKSFSVIFLRWLDARKLSSAPCHSIESTFLLNYLDWAERQKKLSNRSYNNYIMFLFTLFDFFVQRGWAKDNPAANLPKRKVDRKSRTIIPREARQRIKEFFMASIPNYYYVMQLCYRLFIRPHEIVSLRISDIDFDNRLLKVRPDVAKNHNERILGVPDDIMAYFETLKGCPGNWYIFANRNTYAPGPKMMASTRIAERWKMMRDKLKLPASYQFYSLKDTGITEMLEAGVPAKYVKELADHHSLEMTERYTHRSDAFKILEYNKLEF
ncbi:MAG: site-specific integrase [Bacteroidales bacterium]|nr:site-specific integrase [Bacteroidales bacterium]